MNQAHTVRMDTMARPPVWLYGLSTCSICKELKKLLAKKKIDFETIDVDLLTKEEQGEILAALKSHNPKLSFPTLIVDDEIIVGYNREQILRALKTVKKEKKISIKTLFSKSTRNSN